VTVKGPDGQGGEREPGRNQGRGRGAAQQPAVRIPARQGLFRGRVMLSKEFIADRDAWDVVS